MPGTLANPVVLDPWQAIVEVGWHGFTHVEFVVLYEIDTVGAGPFGCSPSVGTLTSDNPWSSVYLVSSEYTVIGPTNLRGRKGGSWENITGAEVSSMPTPASFNYPVWEKVQAAESTVGGIVSGPRPVWQSETVGDDLEITAGLTGEPYQSATTATAAHFGDVMTGSPECRGAITFAAATGAGAGEGPYDNAQQYSTWAVAVAGVTVTHEGKTYTPIGVKPVTNDSQSINLYVLCELDSGSA